jgi:hypothetical protein
VSSDGILEPTLANGIDALRQPSPDLIANLHEAVRGKLSPHDRDSVRPIVDFLRQTLSAKTVKINCLRATIVHSPQNPQSWPVVQWEEEDDTEIVLIVKMDPTASVYSSIMHRTIDTGRHNPDQRWQCELSWNLWLADDLPDLLSVATHVFDLVKEGDPELTTSRSADPLEYATKLFPIFYRMRQFEMQWKERGRDCVEYTSEQEEVEDIWGNKLKTLHKVQNLV